MTWKDIIKYNPYGQSWYEKPPEYPENPEVEVYVYGSGEIVVNFKRDEPNRYADDDIILEANWKTEQNIELDIENAIKEAYDVYGDDGWNDNKDKIKYIYNVISRNDDVDDDNINSLDEAINLAKTLKE